MVDRIHAYAWDIAGLAFVGAAIWVGLHEGIGPPFTVFATSATYYLGVRSATAAVQAAKNGS